MAAKKKSAKPERNWSKASHGAFVGCLFLGLGIGMAMGHAGTGVIIGLGVGFLLSAYLRTR